MKTFSKKDTSVIKGIAIIMLMFHHNFRKASIFQGFNVSFYPFEQSFAITLCNFLKVCVPIFAFLSGYGLFMSLKKYDNNSLLNSRQYSHFVINKLMNLMWGFWFIFIITNILSLVFSPDLISKYFANGGIRGCINILLNFFALPRFTGSLLINGTWWYMALAIVIIFAVPIMAKLSDKFKVFVTISLFILLPRIIPFTEAMEIGTTSNCFRYMFVTLLGVLSAKYNWLARLKSYTITNNKAVSKIIKFVVLTIGLIALYLINIRTTGNFANYIYEIRDGLTPIYIIYYCYEFITDIPFLNTCLAFIGKHSLNIFLFHTFIRLYWFREYTYSFEHFVLIAFVLLAESLVISIIIEFLKKILHYNNLKDFILNKINKKYYSDIVLNTTK